MFQVFSGSLGAALSHPADTLKTRLQGGVTWSKLSLYLVFGLGPSLQFNYLNCIVPGTTWDRACRELSSAPPDVVLVTPRLCLYEALPVRPGEPAEVRVWGDGLEGLGRVKLGYDEVAGLRLRPLSFAC